MHVAIAFDEFETRLVGIEVLQLIIEHGLHRSPAVWGAVGNVVYLDGLDDVVVDARTSELVFHTAGRQDHTGHDYQHTPPSATATSRYARAPAIYFRKD